MLQRFAVRHQLEVGADEIAAIGAGEHHGEDGEVARQHHAGHRRAGLGGEGRLLGLLDQFFQRRRRGGDAGFFQQCLVVEQALRRVPDRDPDQLAVDRHALDEAGRDVAEILDRILVLIGAERLEQGGDLRGRPVIDEIADAVFGLLQAGLAEEPVLQRVGIEGGEGDFGIVGLAPAGHQVAVAAAEHGLVDLVAEHVQRLAGGKRGADCNCGGHSRGTGDEGAAGELDFRLVRHGFLPLFGSLPLR